MKKRKGSALILVICIMVVITIIMGGLSTYFMVNAAQATKQKERIQAYYLVAAGLELGVSALMEPGVDASSEQYYPLLEYYTTSLASDTQTLNLGTDRKVVLTVQAVDRDGKKLTGGSPAGTIWIQITAVGTYTNSTGSTEQAGSIRIDSNNPANIIRELEKP